MFSPSGHRWPWHAMATGGKKAAQHGDGRGLVADQRMGSAEGPGRDAPRAWRSQRMMGEWVVG